MPELDSTLEKYLRCIKPIISEENYKKTEAIVKEFAKPNGVGQKLQEMLLRQAEEKDNWVKIINFKKEKNSLFLITQFQTKIFNILN